MGKNFLSLTGNSSSQTCWEVPTTVTGTFSADTRGYWSTSPQSHANESVFTLTFSGSSLTLDQYRAAMTGFANRLQALGQKQSGRDLAWSSLAWSGLYYPDASTNMAFSTNAEPSVLVQQSTVWFQAAWTAWGMCADFVPRATFSSANKMLTLTWPIAWPGWTPFPANETVFVRNTDFSKSCSAVCAEKGAAHEKLYPAGLSCPASYTYLSRASSFADLPRALRKFGRALPSFASGNQYVLHAVRRASLHRRADGRFQGPVPSQRLCDVQLDQFLPQPHGPRRGSRPEEGHGHPIRRRSANMPLCCKLHPAVRGQL